MKTCVFSILIASSIVGCSQAPPGNGTAETSRKPELSSSVDGKKDNSAVNERDRSSTAKTPIDQNENQKDIDITASIRRQVVAKQMSTNAHNSKIITQDGKVTLRGPVQSNEEKQQIEEIAIDVAGKGNVDNELEVQP